MSKWGWVAIRLDTLVREARQALRLAVFPKLRGTHRPAAVVALTANRFAAFGSPFSNGQWLLLPGDAMRYGEVRVVPRPADS